MVAPYFSTCGLGVCEGYDGVHANIIPISRLKTNKKAILKIVIVSPISSIMILTM